MGSSSSITVISPSGRMSMDVNKEALVRDIGWVADHQILLQRQYLRFPIYVNVPDEIFIAMIQFIQGTNPEITQRNRADLRDIARLLEMPRLARYIEQQQVDVHLRCRHNDDQSDRVIPRGRILQRLGYFREHPEELDNEVVDLSADLTFAQFALLVQDLRGEHIEITDRNIQDLAHICNVYDNQPLQERIAQELNAIAEAIQQRQGISQYITWKNVLIAVAITAALVGVAWCGWAYGPAIVQAIKTGQATAQLKAALTAIGAFLQEWGPRFAAWMTLERMQKIMDYVQRFIQLFFSKDVAQVSGMWASAQATGWSPR